MQEWGLGVPNLGAVILSLLLHNIFFLDALYCSLSESVGQSLIFFGLQITLESIMENVTGLCSSVSVNASNVTCKMHKI